MGLEDCYTLISNSNQFHQLLSAFDIFRCDSIFYLRCVLHCGPKESNYNDQKTHGYIKVR